MRLEDRPKQSGDAVARTIDDAFFILHGRTSELHQFNEVGMRIWEMCDGETSVGTIVTAIIADYDVDPGEAESDVMEFLSALEAKELVA